MIPTRYCRTNPFMLGIYVCAFMMNVCFAGKVVQSPRGIDNYYAAVGDDGFGGHGLGGAVELQRLMPRDALSVLKSSSPARKTSLFKRALLGHRNPDNDKECDSEDCFLTTQTCCGDGCMPIGAECCSSLGLNDDDDDDDDDDLYCERGFRCGIFKDEIKCCRDSICSSEKEAEEESRATTRLSTQVSGFTATTIITPTPPTATFTTPTLLPSVTPKSIMPSSSSITSPLVTSIVPSTTISRAALTTTTTATSAGAATGSSSSSSTRGGNAAAGAGAAATGLANRRVDSSLRVEGGMVLGLIGGFVYAFF